MLIYLDTCSLQRPLDSKSNPRIHLESEAIVALLGLCEEGLLQLLSSDVLSYEIERNPDEDRRVYALEVLEKAATHVEMTEGVVVRARVYHEAGMQPVDGLHLASAAEGRADYFCTCDDRLLRRARTVETSPSRVVSPLELIEEIDQWRSN